MSAAPFPIVVPARLVAGAIQLNRARLRAKLQGHQDCDLEIIIERKHATRSHAQNALYWSVYVELIAEHTGHGKDEIHAYLKAKFLPKKLAIVDRRDGVIKDEFVVGTTTTRLNKIEFTSYLELIQQWAADELGVIIPAPDPEWRAQRVAEAQHV